MPARSTLSDFGLTAKKLGKLTDKQRLFINEYLADPDMNATRAAGKAGYSMPNKAIGILFKNPLITKEIGKAIRDRMRRCEISADRVLQELVNIAFFNPKRMLDDKGAVHELKDLPDEVAVCIQSMKISYTEEPQEDGSYVQIKNLEIKFWDKMQALQMLGKHLGMFDDDNRAGHNIPGAAVMDTIRRLLDRVDSDTKGLVLDAKAITHHATHE